MSIKLTKEFLNKAIRPPGGVKKSKIHRKYVKGLASPEAQAVLADHGISESIERMAHFLGQTSHETGRLTVIRESMYYTSVGAVRRAWGSRSSPYSDSWIKSNLLRNPKNLARWAYNGRGGNRKNSDDGYVYRGGGIAQTTHRLGYRSTGDAIEENLEGNPQLIEDPVVSLKAACAELTSMQFNELADKGEVHKISRGLNRGNSSHKSPANGEADRISQTERMRTCLIQYRLNELGYPAGSVDGIYGHQTDIAMTEFMKVEGLSLGSKERIGETTRQAIDRLGQDYASPKPISETRRNATVSDVRDTGSRTMKGADVTKAVSFGGGTIVGLNAIAAVADSIQRPAQSLSGAVNYFAKHPEVLMLIAACAVGWYVARKIQKARLDDHQSGRNMKGVS